MLLSCLLTSCATLALGEPRTSDPRSDYDVAAYRLDLRVEPETKSLSGWCLVEAKALRDDLGVVQLDLQRGLTVDEVRRVSVPIEQADARRGEALEFSHTEAQLDCKLDTSPRRGETFALAVRYHGSPGERNSFDGFHWARTPSGAPWIGTSMQGLGSAEWFPCKDSFFHPEDKPERLRVEIDVPDGLVAVSNGRLVGEPRHAEGRAHFVWQHDYPLMTYAVTLNVAPYVEWKEALVLDGLARPLECTYFVLPEDREKAELQFKDVSGVLASYSKAFGPFPFPESKFALVETSFWGMEHSTAVAYGNTFPAWCAKTGAKDRYAMRNSLFDYILVHEVAHEWWGNAVSAADWRDFWLHEGFATYAEGVYCEFELGAPAAARYWQLTRKFVDKRGSLDRGTGKDSEQAYANILYNKGAWVLHTLRTFVANDDAWWRTLRGFQGDFRYRNATTEDFRARLERETGANWSRFFDEWFYGSGYPQIDGKVVVGANELAIETESKGTDGTLFHVPLDLEWYEGDAPRKERVMLDPGRFSARVAIRAPIHDVRITSLERVLGSFDVRVVLSAK